MLEPERVALEPVSRLGLARRLGHAPPAGRGSGPGRAGRSCVRSCHVNVSPASSSSRAERSAAGRAPPGARATPSRVSNGSRLTTTTTTLSLVASRTRGGARSRSRASVRFSRRCSAGFARRISFSRRTSGSSAPSSVALLHLVLLRVEVLLAALAHRDVLEVLEARVDPVRRRRASPRARAAPRTRAGRPAAGTRGGCPACSRRSSAGRSRVQSRSCSTNSSSSQPRVLPREVRVGLAEADLRERRHHRRARERLGEEDDVRVRRARTSAISHSQNGIGFVCGLSTRKTCTPRSTQSEHDVAQRLPEPPPVLRVEVDVVDVLVLLRRVLRVLQRAVGAAVEPLRVLLQPRVVGRALDREVERDLAAELAAARDQRSNSSSVPSSGWIGRRGRPPPRRSPTGCPTSSGSGVERVVPPLAVRRPDRVDRRQVDDVEAELRELGQHALDARRSRPTSAGRARTRSRSAHARGRRRARASATTSSRCGRPPSPRAPPRPSASRAEQRRALGELASSGLPAPPRPCAGSPDCYDATRSTHASIRYVHRPARPTLEAARPAVVADGLERATPASASRPAP